MELLIETVIDGKSIDGKINFLNNLDLFFEIVIQRGMKEPIYRRQSDDGRLKLVRDTGIDDQGEVRKLAIKLGNKFPCIRNIWLIKKTPFQETRIRMLNMLMNVLLSGEWRVILFSGIRLLEIRN